MDRSFTHRRLWPARGLAAIVLLLIMLVGATGVVAAGGPRSNSSGELIYALNTRNRLLTFSSDNPTRIISRQRVTGLQQGELLLGIDFRPANGKLYGLGSTSRLYLIDPQSGAAAAVGAAPFAIALDGTSFGFDVNPAVDRVRIVSNTGQNFRVNPNDGTAVDGDLNTAGIQPDGRLAYDNTTADGDPVDVNAGRPPAVVGAAYTNPDNDPNTGTTLYDIDSAQDTLAIQNPPNSGTLNTVGALNVDTVETVGFDIAQSGAAYAALNIGRRVSTFATVDLASGRVTPVGVIGGNERVVGLAVPTQP